jgi:hypothetical protein
MFQNVLFLGMPIQNLKRGRYYFLEYSAAFFCGGFKILTKPLNMIQGFPKVNFPCGISCYKNYGLFHLCIRSRQWEHICGLVS